MQVGRKRTVHKNLPKGLYCKRGRYYYGRNQTYLADNLPEALKLWGQREAEKLCAHPLTFGDLAAQYKAKVIPTKARRTQLDNEKELAFLLKTFGDSPLEETEPSHIRWYLDNRSAKVRANREIALFSAIWNWGRDRGFMSRPNPCSGIKRHREKRRDRFVDHAEYMAVWNVATVPERDAMDLMYLTGQRPADVLLWRFTDIREGVWRCKQGKTGKVVPVAIAGALAAVVEQIKGRKYDVASLALVRDETGQPLTYSALIQRFSASRERAGVSFQLRDLRAKHGTERARVEGILAARDALGHSTVLMTEGYVRARAGEVVSELRTDLLELRTRKEKNGAE